MPKAGPARTPSGGLPDGNGLGDWQAGPARTSSGHENSHILYCQTRTTLPPGQHTCIPLTILTHARRLPAPRPKHANRCPQRSSNNLPRPSLLRESTVPGERLHTAPRHAVHRVLKLRRSDANSCAEPRDLIDSRLSLALHLPPRPLCRGESKDHSRRAIGPREHGHAHLADRAFDEHVAAECLRCPKRQLPETCLRLSPRTNAGSVFFRPCYSCSIPRVEPWWYSPRVLISDAIEVLNS